MVFCIATGSARRGQCASTGPMAHAVQVMSENPYRLARDVRGIGFRTADAIAVKLSIEKTAMIRVRAGNHGEGHCGLPTAEKLLDVPQDLVRTTLDLELADGTVIADRLGETACLFLAGLYRAERAISRASFPGLGSIPARRSPWIEQRIGLTLAESRSGRGPWFQGARHHRRPGRWQDHYCQRHSAHPAKDAKLLARRAYRPRRQAHERGHRPGGQDRPPPPGGGFRRNDANLLDCDLPVVDETRWWTCC